MGNSESCDNSVVFYFSAIWRAIEKIRVPDIREQPPTESTLSSGDDSDIDADEDTTLADATSTAQSTALLRYNFVSAGISD